MIEWFAEREATPAAASPPVELYDSEKRRPSSEKTDLPARGELWRVDLGMIQMTRPVLIPSVAYKYEERALLSFVARTTSLRGTEDEVPHPAPRFLPGAFDVPSLGTREDAPWIRRLTVCDSVALALVEAALKRRFALP